MPVKVGAKTAQPPVGERVAAPKSRTTVKPPGDVIKLEDRLYYVLQPPLETLVQSRLAARSRSSRFRISIKASRFSTRATPPILADEMGLGKTMQAITADPPAAARRARCAACC